MTTIEKVIGKNEIGIEIYKDEAIGKIEELEGDLVNTCFNIGALTVLDLPKNEKIKEIEKKILKAENELFENITELKKLIESM